MRIKGTDGREADLAALRGLLERPGLEPETRSRIERELRMLQAGLQGERDAAYEIEFQYGAVEKRATIHDLRLEVDGRTAQIDHLIIDRLLTIWVCESKHFAEGVKVDERGEWTTYWQGRPRGIPSPVEQNRRHIAVLRDVFDRGLVALPRRLGITIKPDFRSLILVSNNARISRPRSKATEAAVGADEVIKVERLRATLDAASDVRSVLELSRAVGAETVQRLAAELAALHRPPPPIDWAARFGVRPSTAPEPDQPSGREATEPHLGPRPGGQPQAKSGRGRDSGKACDACGVPVSIGVMRYAQEHAARFRGRLLCMRCQHA